MKSELFKTAGMLMSVMPKKDKDLINVFKKNINSNNLDIARIIADELVDFFVEIDDDSSISMKRKELSTKLYDKTMEYYELNSHNGI